MVELTGRNMEPGDAYRLEQASGGGATDHGALTGLGDDDHSQYLLEDGTRALSGNLAVDALVTIDGRDIGVDGAALDSHVADATIHFTEASISHLSIGDIGTNSHAQLDSHVASTANPHAVTAAQAGASAIGHTHPTTDVVSGTFADARVAQSNVTQHQAAIDHDALTNFDAAEHFTEASIDITAIDVTAVPLNAPEINVDEVLYVDSTDGAIKKTAQNNWNTFQANSTSGITITGSVEGGDLDISVDTLGGTPPTTLVTPAAGDWLFIYDLDLAEQKKIQFSLLNGALEHQALDGAGLYTHAQLDDHRTKQIDFWSGASDQTIAVTVIEDTGTIKCQVEESGGGDVDFYHATYGAQLTLDCTPIASVNLTAGTDAAPQANYVYVTEAASVLSLSTSTTSFPAAGWYSPIATVMCQSAASLATDGAFKVHVWTDHLYSESDDIGHLAHLNAKFRALNATWISGIAPADVSGGQLSTTAGEVYQLHPHDMPARDMSTGDPVWVVNDSDAAYTRLTDFDAGGIDKLSDGTALTNNKFFNVVLWGVVSEAAADCKLMLNLPDGQYNTEADAQADVDATAEYSFPTDFVGTAFLIARYTLKYQTAGGGTITQSQKTDLRGLEPSTSPGGGSITDHSQLAGLTDDDHTQYLLADGTRNLSGDLTITGDLTVQGDDLIGVFNHRGDSSEKMVEYLTTGATAVNWIKFNNSNTGVTTVIRTDGSDASVDLTVAPKGSGQFKYGGAEVANVNDVVTPVYYDVYGPNANSGDLDTIRTVEYDTIRAESASGSDYTLTSGEVTADRDMVVDVNYTVGFLITSGTNRSQGRAWIEVDTGAGFSELTGTRAESYARGATTINKAHASNGCTWVASSGDKLRVRADQTTFGSDTFVVEADQCTLRMYGHGT